jgi:hypothetical protein
MLPVRAGYSGRATDTFDNLLSTLCPEPHHCLAFAVEVGLHVAEPLDDGLDPVPEPGAGQVLVDQLHLGLLASPASRAAASAINDSRKAMATATAHRGSVTQTPSI